MSLVADFAQTEYMTTTELAQLFHISSRTVIRWAESGKLPSVRFPGTKPIRIPVNAVAQLIERDPSIETLAGDLAEWLSHRELEKAPSLCPRCAVRSIDKTSKQGWCMACTTEVQISEDEQRERERARKRRWWQENGSEWRAATRKEAKQHAQS